VVVRAGGHEAACGLGGGGGPRTRIDVLESGWGAVRAGEMIAAAAPVVVVVVGREVREGDVLWDGIHCGLLRDCVLFFAAR
jgi:hypothetical protein